MKLKKNLSLLLVFLMLAPTSAGCADNTASEAEADAATASADAAVTETEAETEAETEDRRNMQDEVPELDFGGAAFRSIVQSSTVYDIYTAEETGDALKDSIYYRNRDIEERFKIVIEEALALSYDALSPRVKQSITAGDDEFDLVLGQMEQSGKDAQEGIFLNWYDIPYVDFEKPWWPKSIAREAATVNGKMYNTVSDLCVSYAEQTWTLVYDKVQAENYGIGDLYSMVNEGTWTVDNLQTITEGVYTDINGDGQKDGEDYYGLVSAMNGCLLLSYFYGFDQRLVVVEDQTANMVLNTEKAMAICDKLYNLHFTSEGTLIPSDGTGNASIYTPFVQGHALVCPIQFQYIYSQLRDYENDYGVLPMPKWDEEQEEYYSTCDAGANIMAVPITAQNKEMIGAIVEALSAASWRTVLPTYYDIALSAKSARDDESVEMMDLILSSRVIDFAYLYDGWTGWVFKLAGFVQTEGAFASTYKANEKAMQRYYDKVLAFFYE